MRDEKIKELKLLSVRDKRDCEASYYEFFKRAWKVLEPKTPLRNNWHIKYLCDIFQKEVERIGERQPKGKDIIINICPRSLKSFIVSVMLCPWAWIKYPHLRFINSSHSEELSIKHCVDSREIIQSLWYQRNWGNNFRLSTDQNVKSHFRNNKTGLRLATSVSGGVTGHGADLIISDDLIDPKKAISEAARVSSNDHYDKALYNRLNDPEIGLRVIVQQRVHEEDTTGHVLKSDPENYLHIVIPAEKSDHIKPAHLADFYQDNLFFPSRFTAKILEAARKTLSRDYPGQYNQRVAPKSGNIFDRKWFNFFDHPPEDMEFYTQSWDLSFKKGPDNSFVIGQVWGKRKGNHYLIYQFRKQIGFVESQKAVAMTSISYPKAIRKLVEDKANGSAIMDSLKRYLPGMIESNPGKDSKEARWTAASPIVESGVVWLPSPSHHPWVEDFLAEIETVPNSEFNDQADAMTQYLLDSNESSLQDLEDYLKL